MTNKETKEKTRESDGRSVHRERSESQTKWSQPGRTKNKGTTQLGQEKLWQRSRNRETRILSKNQSTGAQAGMGFPTSGDLQGGRVGGRGARTPFCWSLGGAKGGDRGGGSAGALWKRGLAKRRDGGRKETEKEPKGWFGRPGDWRPRKTIRGGKRLHLVPELRS